MVRQKLLTVRFGLSPTLHAELTGNNPSHLGPVAVGIWKVGTTWSDATVYPYVLALFLWLWRGLEWCSFRRCRRRHTVDAALPAVSEGYRRSISKIQAPQTDLDSLS